MTIIFTLLRGLRLKKNKDNEFDRINETLLEMVVVLREINDSLIVANNNIVNYLKEEKDNGWF